MTVDHLKNDGITTNLPNDVKNLYGEDVTKMVTIMKQRKIVKKNVSGKNKYVNLNYSC